MTIEQGVNKSTRIKRQSAKGSLAGTSGGQIIARSSSINELTKETYTTENQITQSRQVESLRHGVKLVNASLDSTLFPGTFSDIIGAVLLKDFAAVTAIASLSLTIAASGDNYTITRASGSFLTDGVKIGNVVRITAGSVNAANLNNNVLVIGVTALVLTVAKVNGFAMVAEGPIASCTISLPGKVSYVPATGHTKVYYTVEDFYSTGTGYSERNIDVKYGKIDLAIPGTGNATIKIAGNGLDQTIDTTAYFTAPTDETTNPALAAASGALIVNGVVQANVTEMSVSIDDSLAPADGVVGTNIRPDVFSGIVKVSGSVTVYFTDNVLPTAYMNESITSILQVMTTDQTKNADFMATTMSNVKLTSSTPDDVQTGLKRTYNYTATRNMSGGAALANHATSIMIQDSLAA
jgi:carbonic anhydrase/acetyltransferase-like protein (isoleucine patch superfamily)